MPNRYLKESICTSENLDRLDAEEERFFYRLMVQCDDFGRYLAHPKVLSSSCFPLKDIGAESIISWLKALENADIIRLYTVQGKDYLEFIKWTEHQRQRAKNSKYPDSNGDMPDSAGICRQTTPNVPDNDIDIDNDIVKESVLRVVNRLNELREASWSWARYTPLTTKYAKNTEHISGRINEGYMAEDLILILEYIAKKDGGKEESRMYFDCITPFNTKNFERNLALANDWDAKGRPAFKPAGKSVKAKANLRPASDYRKKAK